MTTGELMRMRRKEIGLSADDVAKKLEVSRSTIFRYENGGIEKVPISHLEALSIILKTTPAFLMGWCDESKNPDNLLKEKTKEVLTKLPIYDNPVSAGIGECLGEGHEYKFTYFENVPKDADFALTVRGDSMEPIYFDDDIVFIKANVIVESGQIGVFCLNDEGYLKMLQGNKLVSLNTEYAPITVKEWDNFFCVGRVIGKIRL